VFDSRWGGDSLLVLVVRRAERSQVARSLPVSPLSRLPSSHIPCTGPRNRLESRISE
jgi:hypothetical protein